MTSMNPHEFDSTPAAVPHHTRACLHRAGETLNTVRLQVLNRTVEYSLTEARALASHLMWLSHERELNPNAPALRAPEELPTIGLVPDVSAEDESDADATDAAPAVDGTGTAAGSPAGNATTWSVTPGDAPAAG